MRDHFSWAPAASMRGLGGIDYPSLDYFYNQLINKGVRSATLALVTEFVTNYGHIARYNTEVSHG